ncbi:Transcriptional regulator [Ceratobasidium sp. 392]|nr:Transcriptional regulator [Ceratobasidium sp. 392]
MPLSALPTPSGPSHFLFSSKSDSVPTLDELVQLESELKSLRAEAILRREKADSGSTVVNEFWRRAKEKTKELARERLAKAKDGERIKAIKIKRETTGTPDVEDSDMRYNSYPTSNGHASKGYSGNRSFTSAPTTYKKSKLGPTKKRKHADSDGEVSDSAGTPFYRVSHPHKSSKANGSSKSTGHGNSHSQANPRVAEDFSLPTRETVPSRPNLAALTVFPYLHQTPDEPPPPRTEKLSLSRSNSNVPPIASSSTQPEPRDVYAARSAMNSNPLSVMDDFSAARQPPNQTTIHTFWTAAEPWIKPLGIEDLANLELEGDDVQPYEFVPLGRHYLDRWDDEDTQAFAEELGAPSSSNLPSLSTSSAVASALADSQQPWDPASIGPGDLARDERSLGTVRARLLAAFLPVPGGVLIGKEEGAGEGDEREKERRVGTGSAGVMGVLDVPDLEDRLRAEASAIGLLGDDDSEPIIPADDEIASSLRRLQRILRAQSTLNASRKRLLKDRADEALAYAEYRTTLRHTLDKPISAAYTKILRSSASKPGKKNKNKSSSGAAGAAEENLSAGGIPLELPLELMKRVRLRQRFVDTVRSSLQGGEEDEGVSQIRRRIAMVHFPTEVFLPERSIYEGVEEEVEKEIGWPFRSVVAGAVEPSVDEHSSNGTNGTTR